MDFLIPLLLAPLAVGIYLVWSTGPNVRWQAARYFAGVFFSALPIGGLAYFFAGIEIARWRGVGHFLSVPFGGYAVSDNAVLASLACWVVLVFVIVSVAFKRKLKPPA